MDGEKWPHRKGKRRERGSCRTKDVAYACVYVCLAANNVRRARRLPEIDSELARLLHSTMREVGGAIVHKQGETEEVRQRKMDRMAAVRQHEEQGVPPPFQDNSNLTVRKKERARVLSSGIEKLSVSARADCCSLPLCAVRSILSRVDIKTQASFKLQTGSS